MAVIFRLRSMILSLARKVEMGVLIDGDAGSRALSAHCDAAPDAAIADNRDLSAYPIGNPENLIEERALSLRDLADLGSFQRNCAAHFIATQNSATPSPAHQRTSRSATPASR